MENAGARSFCGTERQISEALAGANLPGTQGQRVGGDLANDVAILLQVELDTRAQTRPVGLRSVRPQQRHCLPTGDATTRSDSQHFLLSPQLLQSEVAEVRIETPGRFSGVILG